MKRWLFTLIFVICGLFFAQNAYAVNPTPTGTTGGVKIDTSAINNEQLRSQINQTLKNDETTIQLPSISFGSLFSIFNLNSIVSKLTGTQKALMPKFIQDNMEHQDNNLYVSIDGKQCIYLPDKTVQSVTSNKLKTEPIPELAQLVESTQLLGILAGYSVNMDAINLPPLEVGTAYCGENTSGGVPQISKPVETQSIFTLVPSIITAMKKLFTSSTNTDETIEATIPVIFSSKTSTPYTNLAAALLEGSKGKTIDLSSLPDAKQENTQNAGGLINTLLSHGVQLSTTGEHGQVANPITGGGIAGGGSVNTQFAYTKGIEQAGTAIDCTLLPKSLQTSQGIAGKCQTMGGGSCSIDGLDLSVKDTACKLCNTNSIKSFSSSYIGESALPSSLVAILEKAGEAFGVPAASILATMYHEGAFTRPYFDWTEENVKKWSACDGGVPECNREAVSIQNCKRGSESYSSACGTSIAGFGWLPVWFWGNGSDSNPWSAVKKIDPSRDENTISPCNFMDAAFATAKTLSEWSKARPVAAQQHSTCFGIPITNASVIQSCGSWNENTVFQTHVGYAGYCPEPGKNGSYAAIPEYKNMVLGWYNQFRCK